MKLRRSVAPNLEIFEEKVLLSTGIGKPAAAVAIIASKAPKPFKFNGKLPLKLTATSTGLAPGFREKQPFPPMGEKVKVSGTLAHPGVASSDGLPNLADSTFQLSNATGSLLVTFSSSTTNAYGFTISGGTKRFVRGRDRRHGRFGTLVEQNLPLDFQDDHTGRPVIQSAAGRATDDSCLVQSDLERAQWRVSQPWGNSGFTGKPVRDHQRWRDE